MFMRSEYTHKFNPDLVEMNEKLRKEAMRTIESYGRRQISDLPDMSDAERCKWFFWNLHENLDELRKFEPALIGQVRCTQMTVTETEGADGRADTLEKRLALNCKWHLRLVYSALKNDDIYSIGDGSSDLLIAAGPPSNPSLQKNQRAYLHADSSLYPNQLFLYGWMSEAVWNEVKEHFYSPSPNCQADILLRDNGIFPVKSGFDFVVGPPGSVGITSMEFRVSSSSGER